MLAGGEGRRMGGRDKGLVLHGGQPLATWGLARLAPQAQALGIVANRNLTAYEALLHDSLNGVARSPLTLGVRPDDALWPERSGPLAGILTALAHSPHDWVLVSPCDLPDLPVDLANRLLSHALAQGADVAIPWSQAPGDAMRHHWVCALLHKRVSPTIAAEFVKGERKVRSAITRCKWLGVCFTNHASFHNINTLETRDGGD
jgi:molybdopterin-guanine dinucleotide biosynthesis protein A